jgi:hypothetical protein
MSWHSLYLRAGEAQAIAAALLDVLGRHSYQRYDPFAGGTGTPPGFRVFVKHFVAPATDGWVRLLGTPDPDSLIDLSHVQPFLHAWLTTTTADRRLPRWRSRSDGLASCAPANRQRPGAGPTWRSSGSSGSHTAAT